MPELLVLNPVKRRRARKAGARKTRRVGARRAVAAAPRRRRARRAANPVAVLKRRSVRRVGGKSRRSVRRRRNPAGISLRSFSSANVMKILKDSAIGGVGAIGMDFVMSKIAGNLPSSMQPVSGEVSLYDAIKAAATVMLGRVLSKTTKGMSEKAAAGALTVQAYQVAQILAAKFGVPTGVAGMGYASPNRIINGTARVSPIMRMNAFQRPGAASPLLSAFQQPGSVSPLLAGNRMAAREGVKYR